MKYVYLLCAGILVSSVHIYLVMPNLGNKMRTLSEYAVLSRKSRYIYLITHIVTEVLFLKFSYQFFVVEHSLFAPHYLNIAFVAFDFIQALFPSRGKTATIHWASAYVSWCCYLFSGVLALFTLQVASPYKLLAMLVLAPTLGMFFYMHINRTKLYPYQLTIVPLFVLYMLLVTIGAS